MDKRCKNHAVCGNIYYQHEHLPDDACWTCKSLWPDALAVELKEKDRCPVCLKDEAVLYKHGAGCAHGMCWPCYDQIATRKHGRPGEPWDSILNDDTYFELRKFGFYLLAMHHMGVEGGMVAPFATLYKNFGENNAEAFALYGYIRFRTNDLMNGIIHANGETDFEDMDDFFDCPTTAWLREMERAWKAGHPDETARYADDLEAYEEKVAAREKTLYKCPMCRATWEAPK